MAVMDAIQKVLDSRVWNANFRRTGEIECMNCGAPIKRRLKPGGEKRRVYCDNDKCLAEYDMIEIDTKNVRFDPIQESAPCLSKDCGATNYFYPRQIRVGQKWRCKQCNEEYIFAIGIFETSTLADEE